MKTTISNTNTSEYAFELESISPMKMDKWLDNVQQPKNEEGYKKLAPLKVYRNVKGEIAIPTAAIKGAMRFASSEVGKKMEAKKNRQTIKSGVFFDEDFLTIGKKDEDVTIVKDVVTRGQGDKQTRVVAFRPLIKDWKCKGTLTSFGADEEFIKACLELAGIRYGLLSHRPEFGRFIVTKFTKVK